MLQQAAKELEFLRARQCDEAQGYYFSRPLPAQHLAKLLRTGILKAPFAAQRRAGKVVSVTDRDPTQRWSA